MIYIIYIAAPTFGFYLQDDSQSYLYMYIFISNLEYVLYLTYWCKSELMYLMRQNRYTIHKTLNNYPKYIYGKSAYKRDDVFDFI